LMCLSIGSLLCNLQAQDKKEVTDTKKEVTDKKAKVSYGAGLNIGNSWKRQDVELDLDLVVKGLKDALSGIKPQFTEQEIAEAMKVFNADLQAKREEKRKQIGEKNKTEGAKFLAENRTKPGVFSLESGLQCKVLKEGTGPIPQTNDTVVVNYRGTLVDGTEFDSSYARNQPSEFRVVGVIPGWTEALQRMKTGSKWQIFVPSNLAYGERGFGEKIGANAALIFEMELLSIKPPVVTIPPPIPAPVTSDIIKVPSAEELKKGAKIEVIKPDQLEKK
jgi:FKBP-type peptidyl-prolyl cis-trans isomerase